MLNRRSHLLAAAAILVVVPGAAGADTLRDALLKAYNSNPTLTGQRAAQRANDENVPIQRAAGLPSANVQGDYTENLLNSGTNFTSVARSVNGQALVSLPVYSGGAVKNSVRAAKTRVEAGRDQLRSTEATVFTNVVGAYMDVIRDEAIVGLNTQNVKVLDVNLEATRDRFQVGDLTRTDVAQSEARLSIARAQLQTAQANLIASRENYVRFVGTAPGTLDAPPILPNLPASPDSAVDVALDRNPALLAAQKERDASGYDISVARAGRLPTVSVTGGGTYTNYLGSLNSGQGFPVGQSGVGATAGVTLRLPLFQGGRPGAQVRQAQALRSQAIEQVTETERGVIAQARSAYAIWQSSQQVIQSSEAAVSANKLSLEGVRAENSVGTRTILDILNAEQELLNSQVTLVTARRDAYVAGFALLAAMGEAEAKDLGLNGGPLYDPVANYNRVRHRINDFDSDPAPQPVASTTRTTPAQGAQVTKSLDPMLESDVDRGAPLTTGENAPNR
ncbi:Outer membrane protein [Sphingomonas sp. EC-HK361]|uniref:TolC family outer membrane protein n=1 Tax=Sphingomonas sp. EC-HK361 TaxID=2038397 RepID=UPI00125154D9|nr:Outer membrane protein [Sphingomonas sp. EC-HK361]